MSTYFTELLQEILHQAQKKGASDAAGFINHDSGFSVNVRMQEVETVAFNEDKNISLVVYFGKRQGSASSTDLSAASIEQVVEAACSIAAVSSMDPCFGLPDAELMTTTHQDLNLYHPWDIEPTAMIEQAISCEKHAMALDTRITNSDGVSGSTNSFLHCYANTNGGAGAIRGTSHGFSCSLIANNGSNMQRDYDYTTARNSVNLTPRIKLAESAVNKTISRLGARKLKTCKTPVLFSSRVSSGLIASFINAISGSNLYRKNSFLVDSFGKLIFPTWMQIYERPRLLSALGSAPFDSEGVPTRDNIFVDKGCITQYVLGSYSARKLGLTSTANSDGVHNLHVTPNAGGLDELIKIMHTGLLVTELMGQGINILTGDYSRGAFGFWIENGSIQYPVEGITVAGNLKEMYSEISAVGNDINPNIATRCGSILISNMTIAGC